VIGQNLLNLAKFDPESVNLDHIIKPSVIDKLTVLQRNKVSRCVHPIPMIFGIVAL